MPVLYLIPRFYTHFWPDNSFNPIIEILVQEATLGDAWTPAIQTPTIIKILNTKPVASDREHLNSRPCGSLIITIHIYNSRFVVKDRETFFTSAQRSQIVWQILMRAKYDTTEKVQSLPACLDDVHPPICPLERIADRSKMFCDA